MKTRLLAIVLISIIGMMMMNGQNSGLQAISSTGKILHDIFTVSADLNNSSSPAGVASLQQEIDVLTQKAAALRNEAKRSPDKQRLLSEAYVLHKKSEAKQIELSKVTEKIMKEQFNSNADRFNAFVQAGNLRGATLDYALDLFSQAKRAMHLAGEMREEANALPNISQTLGAMNNAEEKEWIAVQKSGEALNLARGNSLARPHAEAVAIR